MMALRYTHIHFPILFNHLFALSLSLFFLFLSLFISWSPTKLSLWSMHQVANSAYSITIQVYQYTNEVAHLPLPLYLKWAIPVLNVHRHFNIGMLSAAMGGNIDSKMAYLLFVYLPDHQRLVATVANLHHHLSIPNASIIAQSLDVTRASLQGKGVCVCITGMLCLFPSKKWAFSSPQQDPHRRKELSLRFPGLSIPLFPSR